jgi:multidrug efflux pump subunit AcrB
MFFVTIFIALAISTNTLQEAETSEIRLAVTMPGGSTLETTDITVRGIEERLSSIEEKEDLVATVREEDATITIRLLEDYKDINGRGLPEIKSDINRRLDDINTAEIDFQTFSTSSGFGGGGGGNGPGSRGGGGGFESYMGIGPQSEQVLIKGQDFELMKSVAEDMQYYLEELTSISSVSLSVASNRPEVHMVFDKGQLSERGVPLNNVSSELSSFPSEINSGAVFKEGTEEYDILISRAVAKANILLEIGIKALKIKGYYILMKGKDEEISQKALKELNIKILSKEKFNLPIENSERTIIKLQKETKTNNNYPREFTKIKRLPL